MTRSTPGSASRLNEDSYLALPGHGLFAVADGLGGHGGGAWASHTALEALFASLEGTVTAAAIHRGILQAHARLRTSFVGSRVVGATIVVGWIHRGQLHCFHLGDSRAYRFRAFLLERLTVDHVGPTRPNGAPTPMSSRTVSRALGMSGPVRIDCCRHRWLPGDRLLLVTDGVTEALPDLHISNVMERSQWHPHQVVDSLIADSEAAGGQDDKTALLVFDDEAGTGTKARDSDLACGR